jgi:hypothetical protein
MPDLLKAATNLLNRLEADKDVIEKGWWKSERDNLAECIIKEREVRNAKRNLQKL